MGGREGGREGKEVGGRERGRKGGREGGREGGENITLANICQYLTFANTCTIYYTNTHVLAIYCMYFI